VSTEEESGSPPEQGAPAELDPADGDQRPLQKDGQVPVTGEQVPVTGEQAPVTDEPAPTTGEPARRKAPAGRRRKRSFWIEFPVLVVVALALAWVLKTWVVQAFYIPSGSMQNTLAIGDRLLINKVVYHFRGIARGDIVVFNGDGSWDTVSPQPSPGLFTQIVDDIRGIAGTSEGGDIYIKRVIGLPGDHVVCCDAQGRITVNGVALSESSYTYPGNQPSQTAFNVTVPPGRLWVMGDHRFDSADSRDHMADPGNGTIPESAVLGRAFVIIWPASQWKFLNIPATFSQSKLHS
jgi:signal peptidase I